MQISVDASARRVDTHIDMHDHADSLGSLVKARRRELRLRQDELAALAEVSTRFLHSLEHDKQTIRLDSLMNVLNTLGLTLLVTGPGWSVAVRFEGAEGAQGAEGADGDRRPGDVHPETHS